MLVLACLLVMLVLPSLCLPAVLLFACHIVLVRNALFAWRACVCVTC
jgi:hypothetical protein